MLMLFKTNIQMTIKFIIFGRKDLFIQFPFNILTENTRELL